jgi:hypothetical protein
LSGVGRLTTGWRLGVVLVAHLAPLSLTVLNGFDDGNWQQVR